jgi:hypothetical protein
VIDAAGTDADGFVRIYRGVEYAVVNNETQEVLGSPSPMGDDPDWKPHILAEWAASGIDAVFGYLYNGSTGEQY